MSALTGPGGGDSVAVLPEFFPMKRLACAVTLGALVLAAATPAAARNLPRGGMTLEEVAQEMKRAGFDAVIEGEADKRHIDSKAGDIQFSVTVDDCKPNGRCESMHLSAGFDLTTPLTAAKVNEWAGDKRWASMWLDDEGDPYIFRDVNLSPGGTSEAFKEELGIFHLMVTEATKFIGW